MILDNSELGSSSSVDIGDIGHSLRFRASASAYLSKTSFNTSVTSTYFACVKRGKLGAITPIFDSQIKFNANDTLTAFGLTTTAVFRDPSAFLFIVVGNGELRVNGVSYGAVTTSAITGLRIGFDGTNYADCYMARIGVVDGSSVSYTNFGYLNTEINEWVTKSQAAIKAVVDAGGANSFMLDFDNGTSLTTLGYDKSSKGNNWTLNNFSLTTGSTYDWMLDVPGNSYAVLNTLYTGKSTLSNANLTASGTTDLPTIIPDSSYGITWYFEISGVAKTWTPPASFPTAAGDYNFGQRPWQSTGPSGAQKALCTKNLPDPAITLPKNHFDVLLWAGDSTSPRSISGLSFQPGLVWIKRRNFARSHILTNSVVGATGFLSSDTAGAETPNASSTQGYLSAFNSNGFSVSTGTSDIGNVNITSGTYTAWNWKAGDAPVANNAGSITSQVSANPTAGFSIVTYTGNGTSNATVGHGLASAPRLIIVKNRGRAYNWTVHHATLTASESLFLNDTAAKSATGLFGALPTSSVFTVSPAGTYSTNFGSDTYVAYCFAEIPGYSKIDSYTGNGAADGPFVYCGFKPRWILIKSSTNVANWIVWDSARGLYNISGERLYPNSTAIEDTSWGIDVLSNGFKPRATSTGVNASGETIIYMAFADVPFKYANAR